MASHDKSVFRYDSWPETHLWVSVLGAVDGIVLIFFIQSPHSALPVAVAIRLRLGHCINVALLVHTHSMLSLCTRFVQTRRLHERPDMSAQEHKEEARENEARTEPKHPYLFSFKGFILNLVACSQGHQRLSIAKSRPCQRLQLALRSTSDAQPDRPIK